MSEKALLKKKVMAVLNTASGSCQPGAAARLAEIFRHAGYPEPETVTADPGEVDEALDEAAAKADVIVVLGGDGTIRSAAEKAGKAKKVLIPLPGGTMNVLPHALYGAIGWEEALAATLTDPHLRDVSGGSADGHLFFCSAIVGAPSLWAEAREAVRRGDLAQVAAHAATAIRHRADTVRYRFADDAAQTAYAVAVTSALVSKSMDDDVRALEAAALDEATAAGLLRLAVNALLTDWRNDPAVTVAKVKTVRVWARARLPVILDGESFQMGRAVNISFAPKVFRALTPASSA